MIARDILHHVEIDQTMNEIIRTSKPGDTLLFNEAYSHSVFEHIRHSRFIDKWLYLKMVSFVYKGKGPYIAEGEDRLTEVEVKQILGRLGNIDAQRYFNAFIARAIAEKFVWMCKLDRDLLST